MLQNFIWKNMIQKATKAHGFLDPFSLFTKVSRFSQPSEVLAPTELLRATAVLHARGLLNAQVIQHNLDWIWPFWIHQQFDPTNPSFIPRSFSLTHINLTHRNWTALTLPDQAETPLIDPRGLITPLWDGWSIDAWICEPHGDDLIPSRLAAVEQIVDFEHDNAVVTNSQRTNKQIGSTAQLTMVNGEPACDIRYTAKCERDAWFCLSVRPYNPEGVSLIREIHVDPKRPSMQVNHEHWVHFKDQPDHFALSNFEKGDVYDRISQASDPLDIDCPMEMCSGAAVYRLKPGTEFETSVQIPLENPDTAPDFDSTYQSRWSEYRDTGCQLELPYKNYAYLFEASVRNLLAHTAGDVFAGPYVYKRFWFRDAVYITYGLLCTGYHERAERIIDGFEKRQKASGYFESQEGEWDSNGQVLWLIEQFCRITHQAPKAAWKPMIHKGIRWIVRKRLSDELDQPHAGLMPSGFSAEHFGPNDFYYWDNFWSIAGLEAGAFLSKSYGEDEVELLCLETANALRSAVDASLQAATHRLGRLAIPSSPYRRLDSSAVGSLVCAYPLQLHIQKDVRVLDTAQYLADNCLVHNGLFHDMSHSGINPYLTMHLAQILLQAKDPKCFELISGIAELASPTGQWPEAVHPITRGGCMGDGQHTWASTEWIMMIRNCFVREIEQDRTLVLGSGIDLAWLEEDRPIQLNSAYTTMGVIDISIQRREENVEITWDLDHHGEAPSITIDMPFMEPVKASETRGRLTIDRINHPATDKEV